MNIKKDAVSSLAAAGFFNVDLESPKYADFVASHISSRDRVYSAEDAYVQDVVEYSRRPEVIDEALGLVGGFAEELGRHKYGGSTMKFDMEPLSQELKRTFGRKYYKEDIE